MNHCLIFLSGITTDLETQITFSVKFSIKQGKKGETIVIEQQNYSELMGDLRRNERASMITDKVDELQISDNRSILTWIKRTIDKHHNSPRGLLPIPVLIRGKRFRDKTYKINRLTYQIKELLANP